MFLGELNHPVANLAGIGPVAVRHLSVLGVRNIAQLLRHYPLRYEDRKTPVPLSRSSAENPALTVAEVVAHETFPWRKGMALKVIVSDETDQASMLCYGRNFLAGKLPPGKRIHLYGPFERSSYGELQSGAFVFEDFREDGASREFGCILPVYPLGGTLTQGQLRKAIRAALQHYAVGLRNELPTHLRQEFDFPSKEQCLRSIHFPEAVGDAEKARRALVFEELFHLQYAVVRRNSAARVEGFSARHWDQHLPSRLRATLPFSLTSDQESALEDVQNDLKRPKPMQRLIQGEVGSGKTLVAFLACLGIIGSGRQAAFMAPTELLARQHADTASRLLEPLGVRLAVLSGELTRAARKNVTKALAEGDVDLLLGTHALFSSDVAFKNLGLAVIDEQQRFGVEQRRMLINKGVNTDVLSLSATPIPRTLTLTAFGDMDVSSIRTMPPGRIPVETHLARMGNEGKVYNFVRRELQAGNRAYFVYPLIEESSKVRLKDAENMYLHLKETVLPQHRIALLHSRVEEEEKRRIMQSFHNGQLDALVATNVVEVGVDVPEATCMVVEHAEQFGLSALHQLRGRVGRSDRQSYCFLVYAEPLTDEGKRRMKVMKESNDGFAIAEEDLRLRGPGAMAGVRQSGFLKFSIADPVRDLDILLEARKRVQQHGAGREDGLDEVADLFRLCPPFDDDLLRTG